ncbi:hypothetical protein QQS21_010006 [Conoideocrella luteorostrata]|uniref:Uncharacterized protein n=1 Tax=Conoideocrella luteorostrata TaxID=1105319 RepID=A0AAJ0FPT5_9HYPO|nr:hypothetical protein QQS21_010006 [Conoideocrella luteorostrata]
MDDINYPVHMMDQMKGYRFMLSWTMCFNDVLDASKLQASLSRLLEIGDWRKLAARLRLDKDGQLVACVPQVFSEEHPAFLFHHSSYADISIDQHSLRKIYYRPEKDPFIGQYDMAAGDTLVPPHFPKTFDEMIKKKHPQISLHVISFCDATIIQLTWPHTMSDGPGFQALLQNWSLVMAGRESEVAQVLGARLDVLDRLDQKCSEEFGLLDTKWSLIRRIQVLFRMLWRRFSRPKLQSKVIFIPSSAYQHLLSEARRAISSPSTTKENKDANFISDADIVLAWCSQMVALAESNPKPVLAINIVNPRYRLPSLRDGNAGGVYVQNMSLPVFTGQPAEVARTASVGEMASRHRQHLLKQATEQQMLAFIEFVRGNFSKGKVEIPFGGDPRSVIFRFNNLSPMNLMKAVEFHPAAIAEAPETKTTRPGNNPLGTMVSCSCYIVKSTPPFSTFTAMGKDHEGNFWMSGFLDSAVWDKLENSLHLLEKASDSMQYQV